MLYDSDDRGPPLLTTLRNLWAFRGLIRLLVVRDITVRYKRSILGVWWTLLNPLLTTGALWLVFSQVFRFPTGDDTPYVVYLLSGILLATCFSQGVLACGGSIVGSAGVLSKVYAPPEAFALAAATAAVANLGLGLVPLLLVQLLTGAGVPSTLPLVVIPILALLMLVTGIGMLVAAAAVHFYDVLDLTSALVLLVGYLTPTFYPVSLVPEAFRFVVYANPLTAYLTVFRSFAYEGTAAPAWAVVTMLGTAVLALTLGVWVFSRSWRRLVVLL